VTPTTYATPPAFRQALEARLNGLARKRGVDVQRLRRQVAFDCFLCRLFQHSGERWLLKGGYAMELRMRESRTTRDIDLTTRGPIRGSGRFADRILRLLQAAASLELGDFFVFAVGESTQDLAGAPYGGARFPVDARLAGRVFARFHVDVGTGDPIVEPVETVRGEDWLGFAGIHTRRVGTEKSCHFSSLSRLFMSEWVRMRGASVAWAEIRSQADRLRG